MQTPTRLSGQRESAPVSSTGGAKSATPKSARYDTREKEKTLSWNEIGNLDCLGENLEFASIPESGECHGR